MSGTILLFTGPSSNRTHQRLRQAQNEKRTVITSSCIHLSSWRDVGEDWHSFTALEKPDAISTQRSGFWAPCGASTRPLPLQRRGPGSPGSWGHRASLPPSLGHRGAGPNLSEVGGATWEDFLSSSARRPSPPPPTFTETVHASEVRALPWALQRDRAQPGTCSPVVGPSGIKVLPSAKGRRRFISGWACLWVGLSLWFLTRNTEHSAKFEFQITNMFWYKYVPSTARGMLILKHFLLFI